MSELSTQPISMSPEELLVRAKARILQDFPFDVEIESPSCARIDIYPHQLDTAVFALGSEKRRVLLADEVGLGKTIEAGLIIKELTLKGECNRAIIITPASLVSQWEAELHSKFSLDVHRIESQDTAMLKGDDHCVFLISVDLAKRRLDLFSDLTWDLALFDEAHHLRLHQVGEQGRRATLKYKLAKIISGRTNALIMLTATPMQLNFFEFYALVELIDPGLFRDYTSFMKYVDFVLSDLRAVLRDLENNDQGVTDRAKELILALDRMFPGTVSTPLNLEEATSQQILDYLRQFDFIARVMIRHRKREEFPNLKPRTVHTYPVEYTEDEMAVYGRISSFIRDAYAEAQEERNWGKAFVLVTYQQLLSSSRRALLSTLRKRYNILAEGPTWRKTAIEEDDDEGLAEEVPEELLSLGEAEGETRAVHEFIRDLSRLGEDSKLNSLKSLIRQLLNTHPEEKVIIFTRFIETQRYIREALAGDFSVSSFNGKMSLEDKDKAVEKFKNEAQVLISTEAGGEGRNLQFCHVIVNYDLPWNPVRLEQRIGRIDRIGQDKPVVVTNLASYDTIEQRIMESLSARIAAFESLVGPADPILGSIESDIEKIIMRREELLEPVREFDDTLAGKIEESKKAHSNLNRIISHRPDSKGRMEHLISRLMRIQDEDMESFIFDAMHFVPGARIAMIKPHVYSIRLGIFDKYYATEEPAWTGTTLRRIAVENPDIEFFTRDHQVFKGLLQILKLPDQPVIASQVQRGEKPSILFGIELENARTKQRRISCIRYDSKPALVTPRNFFSIGPRNRTEWQGLESCLDSEKFKTAMDSSQQLATLHAGEPWRFGSVRFLLTTNLHEWDS